MTRLNLAFPTRLLEGTFREKIRSVCHSGANGIQLDLRYELRPTDVTETGKRQIRHLLSENGLRLAPAVFPLRHSLVERIGLEERVAGVIAAIRFASELKIEALILRMGAIPDSDSADRAVLTDVLNDLARAGDHVGVIPAFTNGKDSSETLLAAIREVTAGPVAVNFDPAASVISGYDPANEFRALSGDVRHIRVRDGLKDADGAGVEVPVGRGEVDWEALFASTAEADYQGWLTPDRTTGEDLSRDVARAIEFVKNVMPF